MTPGTYDFTIYQYSTLSIPIAVKQADGVSVFDLSGYDVKSQLRKKDTLIVDFTIDLSSLMGADGLFELSLTDEQTAALTESTTSSYHYDVTIEPTGGGAIERILQGHVMVSKGVTRDA